MNVTPDETAPASDEAPEQPQDPESDRAEGRSPVILGVRFRRAGRIYYFNAGRTPDIGVGERVVVNTARGREIGWVSIATDRVVGASLRDLKPVQRRATAEDMAAQQGLRELEAKALEATRVQIRGQRLPMKAVLAEYTFDGSRVTIYFVSEEQRVDFRELVRDLARELRTRVLLRQIGPRDQAKLLGGIDRCGRELCCTTWMPEFQPISIRMAKHQHLPLNPSEISGVCGKLLCCLAFEDGQYREMRTGLPKVGARLTSAVGGGRVIDVNVLTRKILISWETGSRVEVDADEFLEQQERARSTGIAADFGAGTAPSMGGRPARPAPAVEPPPARGEQRDQSPARDEQREQSPSRDEQRDQSPSRGEQRDPSPARDEQRDQSPSRGEQRDQSPAPKPDRAPESGQGEGRRRGGRRRGRGRGRDGGSPTPSAS